MHSYFDPIVLKDSQRIIAYVVAMHVGDNGRIDIKRIAQVLSEHLSGSFHRPETAIDQYPGVVCPEHQTVAAATATQAFEIEGAAHTYSSER